MQVTLRKRDGPARGALVVLIALVAETSALFAQASQSSQMPRSTSTQDAVVLSTGASRGFAHAGVLVGLDRLGYDPDIVVGTSIGAVVGALYAAGYTPAEIWRIIVAMDWGETFSPAPQVMGPTHQVHTPSLGLGVNLASAEVSRGFVADWRVNRILVHLLFEANAATRGDFDRLPRRYRAIVADLSTGEEIVLGRGDLARAVRTSMGAPGFFAPLEWDGRLLSDGGIANYLPISVARAMAAAPVVAVDVSLPHPRIQRRDPAAIGGRALGLLMRNAAPDTVADVLIRPALDGDFSGAFFPSNLAPLYSLGLAAALELPRSTKVRAERRLPALPDSFVALQIEAADPTLERLAREVFADVAPGPYDRRRILERVDRMYATGLVAGVWPRVESRRTIVTDADVTSVAARSSSSNDDDGGDASPQVAADVLVVRVDGAPRTSLDVAPGYDNDRGGRMWVGLQQRLGTGTPTEVSLAASMNGLERWGEVSLRRHSARRPLSLALGLYSRQFDARHIGVDSVAAEQQVWRSGGWLAADRREVFPDWLATLAMHGEYVDVQDGEHGVSYGPFLRVTSAVAPSVAVGGPFAVQAELRAGDVSYGAVSVDASRAFPLPGFLAAAVAELDVTTGGAPPDARPALGDGHSMPGLAWGAERGNGRVIGGFDLARPFLMSGFLRTRVRGGSAPNGWDELWERRLWVAGAALEGVWNFPFGSILIGGGVNTRRHHRLDVSVGAHF